MKIQSLGNNLNQIFTSEIKIPCTEKKNGYEKENFFCITKENQQRRMANKQDKNMKNELHFHLSFFETGVPTS